MKELIEKYLWFGYLPNQFDNNDWIYDIPHQSSFSQDILGAKKVVDITFDNILYNSSKGIQCVPLSGGIDSRIILGALLERLDSKDIITYSFGRPGQLDFDIAKVVAKKCGVKHYEINLDDITFDYSKLLKSIDFASWTYVPDAFVQTIGYELSSNLGCSNIWSGFMGEALTGGHLSEDSSYDIYKYVLGQKRSRKILNDGIQCSFGLESLVDSFDCKKNIRLSEYLDFVIRQKSCISKIILGNNGWNQWSANQASYNNINIITPFIDKDWAGYWLGLPRKYHKSQALYKRMGLESYPGIFNIPFKFNYGTNSSIKRNYLKAKTRIRNRLYKNFPSTSMRSGLMDNYLNYPIQFRDKRTWKVNFEYMIDVLDNYELDFDYKKITLDHIKGKSNNSEDLLVLLGLSLNLNFEYIK